MILKSLLKVPSRLLLGSFLALIVLYGLLAMDVSRTLFTSLFDTQHRETMISEFEQGIDSTDTTQRLEKAGLFITLQAALTGEAYGFGEESSYDVLIGYLSLPRLNHALLSVHTFTGGIALILMAFLLTPSLRRRWFKYHKPLGRTTASITAISMLFAVGYLITTPEEKVFADKAFYVGLWMLAAITSSALIAAIYAIKNGQHARHQAFMHLTFGALLTAPLLRLDWQIIWLLSDATSFTQNHYLAEIVLLPQCLLLGYLFFLWARRHNPVADQREPLATAAYYKGINPVALAGLLLGATLLSLFYLDVELLSYSSTPLLTNVDQHATAVQAAGATIAENHPIAFTLQRVLMVLTALAAVGLLAWQWFRGIPTLGLSRKLRWMVAGLLLLAGVLSLWIGPQMGSPSHALRSAGGYQIIYGLIAVLLFTLKLWSELSRNQEIEREVYWLTLGLATAPVQFSLAWLLEAAIGSPVLDAYAMGAGNASMGLLLPLAWIYWSQQDTQRRVS